MKIALVQHNTIWADPAANRESLDSWLSSLEGVSLCVFPEMFSTGFATNPEGIAEPLPSSTLEWMKQKASQLNCAMAGSVAVEEGGMYYNRFYFVKPDGSVTKYDKRHLFTFGGEDKTFAAGNERVIVEWKGVRFLLLICYDLRFPVWIRNRGDYDAILHVSSWPSVRRAPYDALVRARAIENQCWFAAVNRVGTDPSLEYSGGSVLVDPYGAVAASCNDNAQQVCVGEIDMDKLNEFRQRFPVLNDADNFEII